MNFYVPCMESQVQMVNTLIFSRTFLFVYVKDKSRPISIHLGAKKTDFIFLKPYYELYKQEQITFHSIN